MADVTVLRCWPACVDAIDWSSDGIIALASDERVELLVSTFLCRYLLETFLLMIA